jgi:hypothetical protein
MSSENGKNKIITYDLNSDNLKDIEDITKLNDNLQELIIGEPKPTTTTDLDFQIEVVKNKSPMDVSKFENNTDFSKKSPFSEEDIIQDYREIRDMIKGTIQSVKEMMKTIPIESGMMKPAMISAIKSLFDVIKDNMKLLLEMEDRIIKKNNMPSKGSEKSNIGEQHNTFVFTGESKDLDDIIRNVKRNAIEMVTGEVVDD